MARRTSEAFPSAVDWGLDPLPPTRWAGAAERAPDTLALVRAAIVESGVDVLQVDLGRAAQYARALIVHAAHEAFLQTDNAGGARAVLLVSVRPDLCDELLWNFFTHQGANGVVVRNHLIGSYLCGGDVTDSLIGGIRDGSLLRGGGDSYVQDEG